MTLDELLRDAGAELDRQSRTRQTLTPGEHPARRRNDLRPAGHHGPVRRPRALVLATSAIVVAAVVALVVMTVARRVDTPTTPANTPPTANGGADMLLPTGAIIDGQVDQAVPDRFTGAIESPTGEVYGISVTENFWGSFPPEWDERQIGDRSFATGLEMEQRSYATLGACAQIAVTAPPGAPAWTASALDLISGVTESNGATTVALPNDWHAVGSEPDTASYRLNFTAQVDGGPATVLLMQRPSATAASFLAETNRGAATPVDFDGRPAWLVTSNDDTHWSYLIWNHTSTAVMLGAANADLATLQQLAGQLTPTTASDLQRAVPTGATATTVAVVPGFSPPAGTVCERSLTIQPSADVTSPTTEGGPASTASSEAQPVSTLAATSDLTNAPPATAFGTSPTRWYQLQPDLAVGWYSPQAGAGVLCFRTPTVADQCQPDTFTTSETSGPIGIATAGNQLLIITLAPGDTITLTTNTGQHITAPLIRDPQLTSWGIARVQLDQAATIDGLTTTYQ